MRRAIRLIIYVLLVTGAAIFSFPFLWMAATSVKVDRELQTEEFRLMPMTPRPRTVSPYVDTRHYEDLDGPYQEAMIPKLAALVERTGFAIPPHVNAELAREQIARGLYDKLRSRLPKPLWLGLSDANQPILDEGRIVASLLDAAGPVVNRQMVAEVFANVYRRLAMGPIRLRSYDRVECELGEGASLSRRMTNETPAALRLEDVKEKSEPYALLRYDFSDADRLVLSRTFEVPGEVSLDRLHRVFVDIRPDDTWHELWLTMEAGGVRYRAVRPWPVANYDVTAAQWQPPGPDDDSTKIKTWIRLEEAGRGAGVLADPQRIKLTFEFRRSGRAGAWWRKLALNYNRVLDNMPFWR